MPIVFDEVSGSVEPAQEAAAEQAAETTAPEPREPEPLVIRRVMDWLHTRALRLLAD